MRTVAAFEYVALDADGRRRKGLLSADSARAARRELRRLRLTPVSVSEAKSGGESRRLFAPGMSPSDVVLVTRQLATLISASTPVEEALHAVALQAEKPAVRAAMLSVRGRVTEGKRLSDALTEEGAAFPPLYIAIVAAGETSGDLGAVLSRLADMLEKARAMRGKALAALAYPAVLAVVAITVTVTLLVFVIPKLVEQFGSAQAELPAVTRAVLGVSNFVSDWGLALLAVIAIGLVALWRAMKAPRIRERVDAAVLKMPVAGKLIRGQEAARFARTLSTLAASGAPLLDALQAASKTVTNAHMRAGLAAAVGSVREGTSLSAALRRTGAFPPMMIYMLAAGERSGAVPDMLDKSATHLEADFEAATSTALKLVEPAIMIVMGGVATVIILAVLLPILQLNTLGLS